MSTDNTHGFQKPKRVFVSDREYIEQLVNASLVKDLHDNEEICPACHGTGLSIRNNIYGLEDDPDKSVMFPYMHQALCFCDKCYNGVVRRCALCGEIMDRGCLKHNCEAQRKLNREEHFRLEREKLEKAPLATEDVLENCLMYYSEHYGENNGYFSDWEAFFDDWYAVHESDDPRPEYVWTTEKEKMSIDAYDVIESATEDMYEDAMDDVSAAKQKELQEYLDNFCKTCGVSDTYYPGGYKVRIPWEEYEK